MTKEDLQKKYNGKNGLWGDAALSVAVNKGLITKADYLEITGKEYVDHRTSQTQSE